MPETLDMLIRQYRLVKNDKETLRAAEKKLNEQDEYLKGLIVEKMHGEGVDKVSTPEGTASVKHAVFAKVVDIEAIVEFVHKSKQYGLFNKAVNNTTWRELREDGVEVPGTEGYEVDKLLFRRTAGKYPTLEDVEKEKEDA